MKIKAAKRILNQLATLLILFSELDGGCYYENTGLACTGDDYLPDRHFALISNISYHVFHPRYSSPLIAALMPNQGTLV